MAAILINQGTQTPIANDTVGTVNYQIVKLDVGDAGLSSPFTGTLAAVSSLGGGTITKLEGGTVQTNILTGTINSIPNLPGGTLGRIEGGTITSLTGGNIVVTAGTVTTGTINTGTINVSTVNVSTVNVATVVAGTLNRINQVGTVEVGTISSLPNLPGGSIVVTAGTVAAHAITAATITAGTLTNLVSGTINAATAVLNSGTITTVTTVANLTNGTIGAGTITSPITVSTAGFTRPGDTTTYTAGDVVSNSTSSPSVITFANAVRSNAAGGVLNSVYMVDNANQTLPGVFELWLFHTTVTATNDNSAWNISDANMLNAIGVVPLSASYLGNTGSGTAGNRVFMAPSLGIPFRCAAGATSLYGVLIARNAYVPVDSENFFFQLGIMAE